MKLPSVLALLLAAPVPVTPFTSTARFPTTSSLTCLFANSQNIRAAMEATEMYGITSPEARLAWETVEEFDTRATANNAYEGNEEYKLTPEQLEAAFQEVNYTMDMVLRMTKRFEHQQYNEAFMKDVVAELQAIKLTPPEKKPSPQIPGLWDAKLKARAISQQFGNDSTEAKLAWEEVEEKAAAGLENSMADWENATPRQLQQAAEACMALDELERFINVEYEKMYYNEQQQWTGQQYDPNAQQQQYEQQQQQDQYYEDPNAQQQYYDQSGQQQQYYDPNAQQTGY